MPIGTVLPTNTLDQMRQIVNTTITTVNSLGGTGTVLGIDNPMVGQILIFDGTTFTNVGMTGDIQIAANGATSIVSGSSSSLTKGRLAFAGAIKNLY